MEEVLDVAAGAAVDTVEVGRPRREPEGPQFLDSEQAEALIEQAREQGVELLGEDGLPLTPAHLLHLTTAAGADALGLRDDVGDLGVGKQFDAVFVAPEADSPLGVGIAHAAGPDDVLAKIFAMGTPADMARVWINGTQVKHDTL